MSESPEVEQKGSCAPPQRSSADRQPETGSAITPAFCSTTLPNGLPPGRCMQGPVKQFSLWYDKTVFLLRNESDRTKRVIIRRTLLNGTLEDFTFDVNYWGRHGRLFGQVRRTMERLN
jgi:hypothetical protein